MFVHNSSVYLVLAISLFRYFLTARNELQAGFSRPWPLILNELGGSNNMSSDAITLYFQPLMDYINNELSSNNQKIGWNCEYKRLFHLNNTVI